MLDDNLTQRRGYLEPFVLSVLQSPLHIICNVNYSRLWVVTANCQYFLAFDCHIHMFHTTTNFLQI
jgi:hypothetical protein